MILTGTQRQRGHLVRLEVDGEPSVSLDKTVFEQSSLSVGDTITPERLEALTARSERHRADNTALYLLSRRNHSARELEQKLRRRTDREVAQQAVARMEELGLVNDETYAEQMARELCLRRHYPCRRAEQELIARGVDREIARTAVEQTESDDIEQALALIRKRYTAAIRTEDGRRKTAAALARAGFDFHTVRRAMRQAGETLPDESFGDNYD